jgi:hypothetical protein
MRDTEHTCRRHAPRERKREEKREREREKERQRESERARERERTRERARQRERESERERDVIVVLSLVHPPSPLWFILHQSFFGTIIWNSRAVSLGDSSRPSSLFATIPLRGAIPVRVIWHREPSAENAIPSLVQ